MTKIIAIRIRGQVDVSKGIELTLQMLRLKRKFAATLIEKTKENEGMLKKAIDYIAFGEINAETLKQLLMKRARKQGDKPLEFAGKTMDETIKKLLESKTSLTDLKIKPFFRLHPPIGGFKKSIKLIYPKGVLGNRGPEINQLVLKML